MTMTRQAPYGETGRPSLVDRFGFWLSERRIRALVGDAAGKRIADVGCGYHARMAQPFLETCAGLVLVELRLAPELKTNPKVTAIEGRLPNALATLPDASLDVILCNSVLEHLSQPQETLNALRRLLKPGGVLYLNVPNWLGKWFLEFSAYRLGLSPAEEIDDHKAYYDPEDLWPMLVAAGFRPSDTVCYRHKFGLNTFAECRAEAAPAP
ncbi:MAG: class I SAM-dependent methyltransferase [Rhodospirillales bacterium]|nr:class I SAM-dependent methyltransferase [Rhodospirillales bacterium]